jgi:hypothetical protein
MSSIKYIKLRKNVTPEKSAVEKYFEKYCSRTEKTANIKNFMISNNIVDRHRYSVVGFSK